jgi:two-component system, OmpR family, response regulator
MTMSDTPVRILVVDDEDVVRSNIAAYLEDEGFTVETAESGERALEMLALGDYNVGIIDMRLPGIDGNALIARMSEIKPRLRYIIHTGSVDYRLPDQLRTIGIGQEHIFLKPLRDLNGLVRTILALAGRAK